MADATCFWDTITRGILGVVKNDHGVLVRPISCRVMRFHLNKICFSVFSSSVLKVMCRNMEGYLPLFTGYCILTYHSNYRYHWNISEAAVTVFPPPLGILSPPLRSVPVYPPPPEVHTPPQQPLHHWSSGRILPHTCTLRGWESFSLNNMHPSVWENILLATE